MAYVPVPKDLTKVKTKVMFNLTRRQLVCFTAGALVGVPLFLWLREPAGRDLANFRKQIAQGRRLSRRLYGMYARELFLAGEARNFLEAEDYFFCIVSLISARISAFDINS